MNNTFVWHVNKNIDFSCIFVAENGLRGEPQAAVFAHSSGWHPNIWRKQRQAKLWIENKSLLAEKYFFSRFNIF